MTLKTWEKEFYPKSASSRMTKRQAIEHSLKKWQGLTHKNLIKHGLETGFKSILEIDGREEIYINSITCALCVKYLDYDAEEGKYCVRCPLVQTLGKPCDIDDFSPYVKWFETGNPAAMIKALQKALEENK